MTSTKVFLTVDSGGSKTKLCLYDYENNPVKDTVLKGFGAATESDLVIEELKTALVDFCSGFSVSVAVCNLGGRNKEQMRLTLKSALPNAKVKVYRESEGFAGVELCKMFEAEVTLMAGTGTIAVAPVKDKIIISCGWGPNISDKGSGYALGLAAVQQVLEEVDGVAPLSLMAQKLTGLKEAPKELTAEEYCAMRDKVRQNMAPLDRSHIASFAKVVYDCAVSGDEKAMAIHQKIGLDLADVVLATVLKTGRPLKSVVVTGGMTRSKDIWQEIFEESLKERYEIEKVYYVADGIADAMRNIALNSLSEV